MLPHLDRLLAFARRRTDSAEDAEDAVQEACVR
ncbi:MAG: sigma factor, partial [Gemmatirosa sp.]